MAEKRVDIILQSDGREFSFYPDMVTLGEVMEYLGKGNHIVKFYNLENFKEEHKSQLRDLQRSNIKPFYDVICSVLHPKRK